MLSDNRGQLSTETAVNLKITAGRKWETLSYRNHYADEPLQSTTAIEN